MGIPLTFFRFVFPCLFLFKFFFSLRARCFVSPHNNSNLSGDVFFTQDTDTSPINVHVRVYGATSVHGFHIHEKPYAGNCMDIGMHFNPYNKIHGGLNSIERHLGDMGNIQVTNGTNIYYKFTIDPSSMSLFGENTIIGRTCAFHANIDDLGLGGNEESLISGNSGSVLACGRVQGYSPVMPFIFGLTILMSGICGFVYYIFVVKVRKKGLLLTANEVKAG